MFIQTEPTPNPETLKFLPGRQVMSNGTNFYNSEKESDSSPFAKRLFSVEGVKSVFFGSDFTFFSICPLIIVNPIFNFFAFFPEIYKSLRNPHIFLTLKFIQKSFY